MDKTAVQPFNKADNAVRAENMASPIDLYYFPTSPPTRAVMMLAHALGILLNLKMVNIMEGEQMKPEFLKINPMHTVPTMDDSGYVLWESKAIMHYFIDKYDKNGKYKADNITHEGRVNQIMYFEGATLFPRMLNYMQPVFQGLEQPNNEKLSKIEEALAALETLLDGHKYCTGSHITTADFALAPTISTLEALQVNLKPYKNVMAWLNLVKKELPGYNEINQKASDMIASGFKAQLA